MMMSDIMTVCTHWPLLPAAVSPGLADDPVALPTLPYDPQDLTAAVPPVHAGSANQIVEMNE